MGRHWLAGARPRWGSLLRPSGQASNAHRSRDAFRERRFGLAPLDRHVDGFAGRDFVFSIVDRELDRLARIAVRLDPYAILLDRHSQPIAPIGNVEAQSLEVDRKSWIEPEPSGLKLATGVAALQNVDCRGHRTEMNSFRGRTVLGIRDVLLQRIEEEMPRGIAI